MVGSGQARRLRVGAWLGWMALVATPPVVAAQSAPTTIARLTGPIRLDGRPDEAAWQHATPLAIRMFTPVAGGHTTDSTEVRLLHDDSYLYAAGTFYTPDPTTIRPGLFARDQMGSEDHFMVILDAANDNQTALVFTLTPSGARTDFAVGGDGQTLDRNWNGYWDGATSRDDRGWYAEMRIPLSTLRFQAVDGAATMGLIIHRFTSLHNEYDTHPNLSPSFANALFRSSIANKIRLAGVRARSPLYLTPYALAGASSTAFLPPAGTRYDRDATTTREAGVDAKFGITSSLVADLTANTDFAQVEADNQQVNLTRFSLFFPEKRQFFLERADLFAVGSGHGDLLFHSRRIGLAANGSPLRIYGGARVVGRIGGWDVGAMSMQTETASGQGTENDAAFRVRGRVFNDGSYLGGLVTSRLGGGGHSILAAGDAVLRPLGNEYLTVQAARSFDDRWTGSGSEAAMARVGWARRSNRGLQYATEARWIGAGYDPALGFLFRNGITHVSGSAGYGWFPGAGTIFANVTPSVSAGLVRRHADHQIDTRDVAFNLNLSLKSGHGGFVGVSEVREDLPTAFPIGPRATIPAGDYDYAAVTTGVFTNGGRPLSFSANATVGRLYDGTQTIVSFSPQWNASAWVQLGGTVSLTRLRFADRGERVDADLARLRLQLAMNSRISTTAFLQYNRAARTAAANVRFRWQFAEGRDLWVVYNDLLNTDRTSLVPGAPDLPRSTTRTVLVKYTHTFVR